MSRAERLLFLGIDGMIASVTRDLARQGALPHIAALIGKGVWFSHCRPAFPSITPTCWATLATGCPPSVHGVTGQHVHLPGTPFDATANGYRSELCQAERFWDVAARLGKRAWVAHYPTSGPPRHEGITQINGTTCTALEYAEPSRAGYHGVGARLFTTEAGHHDPVDWIETMSPASGQWRGPDRPTRTVIGHDHGDPMARLHVNPSDSLCAVQAFDWYAELTGTGVCLRETSTGPVMADVPCGQWSDVLERTLHGTDGARSCRFRFKVLRADRSAHRLALFFTPVATPVPTVSPASAADIVAGLPGVACHCSHAGHWGAGALSDDDYLAVEAMNLAWLGHAIEESWRQTPYAVTVGYTVMIDTINHRYARLLEGLDGTDDERRQAHEMQRQAYELVDRLVGRLVTAAGPGTLVALASDHGRVSPQATFDPQEILRRAGLLVVEPDTSGGGRKIIYGKSRAVPVGSVHIFVNMKGRDPGGIVEPGDYDETVDAVIAALTDHTDPVTGQKVAVALRNKDAALLGLGGERTGDVVWGVTGRLGGHVGGIHACQIPTASSPTGDIRAALLMAGPGIKQGVTLTEPVWQWDVAPTLCHAMGWPAPQNATGRVIRACLDEFQP